jgi:hypothetical protein
MKMTIQGYHGRITDKQRKALIDSLATVVSEGFQWEYNGSLDDFKKSYGFPFLVIEEYIFVTQYSTFGQR